MKRLGLVLTMLALGASCAAKDDGPTPEVSGVTPDVICTAQADITITVAGSGFSPVVVDGLTDTPSVVMPDVLLIAPDSTEYAIPTANVSLGDTTGTTLTVIVPMGFVAPAAAGETEVVYGLRVVNPTGNSGQLADALTIVPPPSLDGVEPDVGAADTIVSVALSGTGFRDGMTVSLDANPAVPGDNVVVVSPTSATLDFDLTGVAAGTYSITITNPEGCSDTLANAFTVYEPRLITILGIDPPFGCTCSDTTVTILSDAGFVSTPRVEMRPSGQDQPVIAFERVAFIDANTLTAVVPAGAPLGSYDVTVYNPPSDGGIGQLDDGFRVVELPIPSVEAIVPSRGDPGADTPVVIHGENFRDPVQIELLDFGGNAVATIPSETPISANQIDTVFPTNGMAEGVYLVRVTNLDEQTYSTFSNFLVAAVGPSGNLHPFNSEAPLNTGRRSLAGASARDDDGNYYVYAIGGDTGDGGAVLDTVEVSQLSRFGELGTWRDNPNRLTTPRVGAAAAVVPIFQISPFIPVKTYVYVLGGRDDGGAVLDSIERAVVLSADDAPVIQDAGPAVAAGTLDPGTWYYKISAVLDPGDPDNPGGETLASDEAIVTVAAAGAIELSWSPVNVNGLDAVEYRVYRTDAANGSSQAEHLIATTTATSFTDSGEAAGTEPPLPPGALGVWVTEPGTMLDARWGHGVAVVTDTAGQRYLYAVGGKNNPTDGYLGSVEYSAIDDITGSIGAFDATLGVQLSVPRAFFSLTVENPNNVSGYTGGARLFAVGGVSGGAATDSIEMSDIIEGGGNLAWESYTGSGNLQPRAGVQAVITSEKLFALGGGSTADDVSIGNILSSGRDLPFRADGSVGSPIQSTAEGLLGQRALGAVTIGSGFVYFLGGTSDGTDALTTTERTF